MPLCRHIITTGGLAGETLCRTLGVEKLPKIGESVLCPQTEHHLGRDIVFWRMPSSSRAYPLKLEKKAEFYARLFGSLEPVRTSQRGIVELFSS